MTLPYPHSAMHFFTLSCLLLFLPLHACSSWFICSAKNQAKKQPAETRAAQHTETIQVNRELQLLRNSIIFTDTVKEEVLADILKLITGYACQVSLPELEQSEESPRSQSTKQANTDSREDEQHISRTQTPQSPNAIDLVFNQHALTQITEGNNE